MYAIEYVEEIADDLRALRRFEIKAILDEIDIHLTSQPMLITRNRKPLIGIQPTWAGPVPFWELRIGEYRVFYDVSESENRVIIRAIRRKPPHTTTADIL